MNSYPLYSTAGVILFMSAVILIGTVNNCLLLSNMFTVYDSQKSNSS